MKPSDEQQPTGTLQVISWLTAAEYVSEALYFARGTILAALIGPQAFGIWSSMRIVVRFLPYAPLGSLQGVLQLAPKAEGAGDTNTADRYRSTTVALSMIAAIPIVMAIVVFSFVSVAPGNLYLWLVFGIALLPMQIYNIQEFMLRSQERFLTVGTIKFGLAVSTLLFGLFAAEHFGLLGFLVAVGCSYLLVTSLTTGLANVPPRPVFESAKARQLVTTGSTILVAEILLTLLQNVDKVLVVILLGSHALGLYAITAYVVHAALIMPQVIATVLYPRLMVTQGSTSSRDFTWPYLERATIVVAYVSCPVLAFLSLVLHLPIEWWLSEYAGAIAPGRALIIVAFLPIVAALPATVLISLSAQKKLIAIRALAVIISIVCITVAIQYDGDLATVALATAPGFALVSLATIFKALKESGLPLRRRAQVLLSVFAPYALLLLLYRMLGPVGGEGGDLMDVAWQIVFVCGPLLIWGVYFARRMELFRKPPRQ